MPNSSGRSPQRRKSGDALNPSSDNGGATQRGGQLLATISTQIVAILREHYGRGPMMAKTYALDDVIVVVLRGSGFTPLEKTIMESGQPERVVAMREDFHAVMSDRFKETIEALTGRHVVAFLSQAHVDPDVTIEIFFVDAPLDGIGPAELSDGGAQAPPAPGAARTDG